MSTADRFAIVLGIVLTAVVCLAAGVFIGIAHMRYEAVKYGHAESAYMLEGEYVRQWRWKPGE